MNILVYGFSGKILGGIETFILNMNEHMSRNCVFDYIIDGSECVYSDRINARGGSVFFVPGIKKHPFGYILQFIRILKNQKAEGIKILYIQLFSMANMLPALLAKMNGYSVILHSHNNGLQNKNKAYKFIHLCGKVLTKKMNFIRFTNSQLSSDFMFGKGVKSELIYNAIDLSKFKFCTELRDKVREQQNSGDKPVVGFVGRFMMQKNPLFMIRVFSELTKLRPDCELWIVGEGDLQQSMQQETNHLGINNSVKWLGRRNDVEEIMQGMDLLLQPSLFEGLGIVLIEAQATGLPVVSSAEVVPNEAKASDNIQLVKLDAPTTVWASVCDKMLSTSIDRTNVSMPNHFHIDYEAKRLETVLANLN